MDVSFLKEPRNALPHRHCSFHTINRPQSGPRLKYFMRLGAIGIAYCGIAPKSPTSAADLGLLINYAGPRTCRYRSTPRCRASIVSRQFELPQWQANFFFDFSVIGSSISIA